MPRPPTPTRPTSMPAQISCRMRRRRRRPATSSSRSSGRCRPTEGVDEIGLLRSGQVLMSPLGALTNSALVQALAAKGVTAFALELIPRITRAQSMDILCSQANLAGYKAVLLAANNFGRIFPQMMTPGRHAGAGARLHHGRRRGRPAGDRHGAAARRDRDGDRRAAGDQGAGRSRSAASSSPSRTRSSRRPRPRAATPSR